MRATMVNQDAMKKAAAMAALQYVQADNVIGVGTGSTVRYFIEGLAELSIPIEGAVASSVATENLLKAQGITLLDLNTTGNIALYVDGADEVNSLLQMIKGGGGALTREKIIAAAAQKFVCIADASKRVGRLGRFPLPIEVIPMARSYVARKIVELSANPVYRQGLITDNGNVILDIFDLNLDEPIKMEATLNNISGVVCNGLFAQRGADLLVTADNKGVVTHTIAP